MGKNEPKTLTIPNPRKTMFKASGATLAALLVIAFIVIRFSGDLIDTRFMSHIEYDDEKSLMHSSVESHETTIEAQIRSIADTQASLQKILLAHISEISAMNDAHESFHLESSLGDAVHLYNSADNALHFHQRFEAKDGVTDSSANRRHELERRKIQAKEYRDCIIAEGPNCSALRPQ